MSFTKKNIPAKTYCIIDIGSYKIRLCAAHFKNRKISVIWYHEKRQNISYFSNNECHNLSALCQNISEAFHALEEKISFPLDEIILSYPFGEIFYSAKQVHYKRKHKEKILDQQELGEIFQALEKMIIQKQSSEIQQNYGYEETELQVILSRVYNIKIDGKSTKKLLWESGEHISISLSNGIIPKSKHTVMMQIGNVVWKNIKKVIPSEYAVSSMFQEKNLLIVNIWATATSLTLKHGGNVIGISKVPIWIHSLIEKLAQKYKKSRAEIIETLSYPQYQEQRSFFLEIWGKSFILSLKEIVWKNICPKKIYLGWGGANNKFIQEYIQKLDFSEYWVSVPAQFDFISEDLAPILQIMENIQIQEISKISLEMYSLLLETHHLIKREHDIVSNTLKSAIKRLGYISK